MSMLETVPKAEVIFSAGCTPIKWTHAKLYYPATGLLEERIELEEATAQEIATLPRRKVRKAL